MQQDHLYQISDWDSDQPVSRMGSYAFFDVAVEGTKIIMKIIDLDLSQFDEIQIVPVLTGKLLPVFCITTVHEDMVEVDLSALKDEVYTRINVRYRLALAVRIKNEVTFYNLKCRDSRWQKKKLAISDNTGNFLPSLWDVLFEDTLVTCIPYFDENRQFMISLREKKKQYMSQVINELLQVRFSGPYLKMKALCWDIGYRYVGFVLAYRSRRESDQVEYFVPGETRKSGKKILLSGKVDIREIPLQMLYWDIHTVFEKDGELYYVMMKTPDLSLLKYYETVLDHYSYKFDNGNIVFAYFTQGNSVALRYRQQCEWDTIAFRLKERVALVLHKAFKSYWESKNIYLVYEKNSYMAQDNGYYFFKYCMEHEVEKGVDRKILYLMDAKSPDYQKLAPYRKHVVKLGSIRHMIYLKAARLLISSETKDHAYIWRSMGSRIKHILQHKKLVFLQHGVTAFKKNDFLVDPGKTDGWEMFVTTSEKEKAIIAQYYPEEKIKVTGFSRWDVLVDKSGNERQILMMPTWRNWLDDVDDASFLNSEYFSKYRSLLLSERLHRMLETYDAKMVFYIHPKFREHVMLFSNLDNERIRLVAFGQEQLNELMMECKMLITDYSSVSWDMFYQKKPVLFYQFDLDDYNETAGSYIDMEKELFGERTDNETELLDILESYLKIGMKLKPQYGEMLSDSFKYQDQNNSKRIWDAIITEVDPA